MTELITKSGAKVVVSIAPWSDARKLKAAVERQLAGAGVKIDMKADATALINALLLVDSSDEVDAALWPCLNRCLRNREKIIPSTFDTADARADYYEIVAACFKENFAPFVESLLSLLPSGLLNTMKGNESTPPSP